MRTAETQNLYDQQLIENYNKSKASTGMRIDEKWEKIQNSITNTAEVILGKSKRSRKPLISSTTSALIEEKRILELRINHNPQQETILAYNAVNKTIKNLQ